MNKIDATNLHSCIKTQENLEKLDDCALSVHPLSPDEGFTIHPRKMRIKNNKGQRDNNSKVSRRLQYHSSHDAPHRSPSQALHRHGRASSLSLSFSGNETTRVTRGRGLITIHHHRTFNFQRDRTVMNKTLINTML